MSESLPDGAMPGERPDWASDWGRDDIGPYLGFTINGVTQRMRWIPPGRFLMGSPETEFGRFEDEGPRHEVRIASGFWLFDTPCTQALWQAVMGTNPSRFADPVRPVEQVSFEMAQAFMSGVNSLHPGLNLFLPSEAQWEYACRAGTETATYAGDLPRSVREQARLLDSIACYGANAKGQTQPVGQKRANASGLHDMLGNVWEWCEDEWHNTYAGAPTDGSAWLAGGATPRVLRGGSWNFGVRHMRSARRPPFVPAFRFDGIGFRCARVQVSEPAAPPTPQAARGWYVSYAWGDQTPEGRARDDIVNRICAAAETRGIIILRDQNEVRTGDSISRFMRRIGAGDRVFVILSEKYLRSEFCMFELHEIWRNSRGDDESFRERVRVFALPETPIDTPDDWTAWGDHWRTRYQERAASYREKGPEVVGVEAYRRLRHMQEFYTHISDILGTLAGIRQPRTFGELERYGFDDLEER